MNYSAVNKNRTLIIRLHYGAIVHEQIEKFVYYNSFKCAKVQIPGAMGACSSFVTEPGDGRAATIVPIITGFNLLEP
jgi:predicted DNA-binding protein with PD1-like motif